MEEKKRLREAEKNKQQEFTWKQKEAWMHEQEKEKQVTEQAQ